MDGYEAGNEIAIIWFDASENQEITLEMSPTTSAALDDPVAPTHSGFGAGIYARRSMVYGVGDIHQLPKQFKLGQNFPNPFNAETVIPLELPQRSQLNVDLFNVRGQHLGTIYDKVENAGWHRIQYDANHLPSGVYFYRISAKGLEKGGTFQDVGKMLLLK